MQKPNRGRLLFYFFCWCLLLPRSGSSQKAIAPDYLILPAKIRGQQVLDSFAVNPFSIVQYNLLLKVSSPSLKGYSLLGFYDSSHKELLRYRSGPVSSLSFQSSGNYTLAPPFSSYAKIWIETADTGREWLLADSLQVKTNIGVPAVYNAPRCNLDQYLKPFWNSDTVYNETVLMYSDSGQPARGRLLYQPDQIISVQPFDLSKSFQEGKDYTVESNTITRLPNSDMPFTSDSFFNRVQDLAWYDLQSRWVVVSYSHHDQWEGPVPAYKGGQLPDVMAKLKAKLPVKIIGYGMSITRGLDVSSYDDVSPYMPTYLDLFAQQLRRYYQHEDIGMINAGLPGALVSWAADYAEKYINPLQPDLVILDFGMNDFWRYTPAEFKGYIQTIIQKVKRGNPAAEFLLVSNMDFDPDYILPSDKNRAFYISNMQGYKTVLREMETGGIINLDMTTLSDLIYRKKKAKDCITNPLHPNDYLARWYAQGLTALLCK